MLSRDDWSARRAGSLSFVRFLLESSSYESIHHNTVSEIGDGGDKLNRQSNEEKCTIDPIKTERPWRRDDHQDGAQVLLYNSEIFDRATGC